MVKLGKLLPNYTSAMSLVKGFALGLPAFYHLFRPTDFATKMREIGMEYTAYNMGTNSIQENKLFEIPFIKIKIPVGWVPFGMVEAADLTISTVRSLVNSVM